MMKFEERIAVLLALITVCAALTVPIADSDASEDIKTTSRSTTEKESNVENVSQAKQYIYQAADIGNEKDEYVDYSILPLTDTPENTAAQALLDLSALSIDGRRIIGYAPLKTPHGGALVLPAGAVRIVGQAHVSIRQPDEDDETSDEDNRLSEEEERAIRRRRRIRKRNNKGSLQRRRRRKGDNERRHEDYYGSSSTRGNRRKSGSSSRKGGNRRKTQRRKNRYAYDYE